MSAADPVSAPAAAYGVDLPRFLRIHGVSLDEVRSIIAGAVGMEPGEAVFLSGSLLEGFGTERSDLDVFLVTDRPVDVDPRWPVAILRCKRSLIDLECWGRTRAEALLDRLAGCSAHEDRDPREALTWDTAELDLLHRLRIGIPLEGGEAFDALRARLHAPALSRVLFDRARSYLVSLQMDVAGLLEAGDGESAYFLSQELLGLAGDCLLAALGDTNPKPKWRFRKLRALDPARLDGLPGGPLLPTPADAFLDLYRSDGLARGDWAAHARRCIHLANRVVPWGQARFLAMDDAPAAAPDPPLRLRPAEGGEPLRPRTSVPAPDAPLPALALTVLVRWMDGRLLTGHIRDTRRWEVDFATHRALLRFDGATPADAAARALAAELDADPAFLLPRLLDLAAVLASAGLLASPAPVDPSIP